MRISRFATGILLLALAGPGFVPRAGAATIAQAEYFIDDDPGVGKATPLDANDGTFNSKEEGATKTIETATLSVGPHQLGVRFKASDGTWSYTRTTWFYVTGARILTGAEWFVDRDPGKGKGHAIALPADSAWDEPQEEIDVNDIDVSGLDPSDPNGHTVFVRFRDSDGNWGLTQQATFEVCPELYVAGAEWTTDPLAAPGTGHPIPAADGIFDGPEEELLATGIDPALLGGLSQTTVYVRVRDNLGRWSTRKGWCLGQDGTWYFDPAKGWVVGPCR